MKCLLQSVALLGSMAAACSANANCRDDGQRVQEVSASSGAAQLDSWAVNPSAIHAVRMPDGYEVGVKIDDDVQDAYARALSERLSTDELVRISIYDMQAAPPKRLTYTYGGANSLQAYSKKGGADRVVELGSPGLTLFLHKPVCVTRDDVGVSQAKPDTATAPAH